MKDRSSKKGAVVQLFPMIRLLSLQLKRLFMKILNEMLGHLPPNTEASKVTVGRIVFSHLHYHKDDCQMVDHKEN